MMKPALLILSLTADGGTRATLADKDSMELCETSREAVVQILTEAGRAPLLGLCGETDVRVTPYKQGPDPEGPLLQLRIEGPATGGFSVTPLAADAPCEAAPDADPAVFCAHSTQQLLSEH
jgi:hypothetical protein